MDIIFNINDNGQNEVTNALSFLDQDFSYSRLEKDLILNTQTLIDFIGEEVYNDILTHYNSGDTDDVLDKIVLFSQLFIAITAYYDLSGNNDLLHTNSGRKFSKSEDETAPWDWQIASDNVALLKRSYKALDMVILLLNKSDLNSWKTSSIVVKSLFVNSTKIFNDCYSINKSHQLYFRLVPFMEQIELLEIESRLSKDLFVKLKKSILDTSIVLSDQEKTILQCVRFAIVYSSLAKGYKVLKIEMFPNSINYNPRSKTNTEELLRVKLTNELEKQADFYLKKIEGIVSDLDVNSDVSQEYDSTYLNGLNEDNKYVDL